MGRYTHIKEAAYEANAQILVNRLSIVAELANPGPGRLKQTLIAKHYTKTPTTVSHRLGEKTFKIIDRKLMITNDYGSKQQIDPEYPDIRLAGS